MVIESLVVNICAQRSNVAPLIGRNWNRVLYFAQRHFAACLIVLLAPCVWMPKRWVRMNVSHEYMYIHREVCPDSSNCWPLADQVLAAWCWYKKGSTLARDARSQDHRKHCLQSGVNLHFRIMAPPGYLWASGFIHITKHSMRCLDDIILFPSPVVLLLCLQ